MKKQKWFNVAMAIGVALALVGAVVAMRGVEALTEYQEMGLSGAGVTDFDSITLAEDLVVGDDATVTGDVGVGGDLTVTGDVAVTGEIAAQAPYAAKAANYTVLATDTGGVFSNGGASGGITFTLPSAAAGLQYTFYISETQIITITPASGDMILHLTDAVDNRINDTTAGDCLGLVAIDAMYWIPLSETGTWGDAN